MKFFSPGPRATWVLSLVRVTIQNSVDVDVAQIEWASSENDGICEAAFGFTIQDIADWNRQLTNTHSSAYAVGVNHFFSTSPRQQ